MNNPQRIEFSHLLQKQGILKNFSIAKIVPTKDIELLKQVVRDCAKDEAEFNALFKEEMAKLGNMHDPKTPIPGILYLGNSEARGDILTISAEKSAKKIKEMNLKKSEICFLILSLINFLGLKQKDFNTLDLNEFGVDHNEDEEYDDGFGSKN